jgi:hypothetical protein
VNRFSQVYGRFLMGAGEKARICCGVLMVNFVVECGVNVVDKTTLERDEKDATFCEFIFGSV